MNKCVFLDRDGVLNVERGDYTWRLEDFEIVPGVPEAIRELKKKGYLVVVATNQAGIAKGVFTREDMHACHQKLQQACDHLIDAIYYSPHHPNYSNSLTRKPDSLMFEKAITRFDIDPAQSWMVGDKERDLIPARKLGISTIAIGGEPSDKYADYRAEDLISAVRGGVL
jgi:D-glycero-D-manno-heptose 1,7-bisphosphate phosphatase